MSSNAVTGEYFAEYEGKLRTAKLMASIANVMYGLNWFLGFCALTWASAVILGGLLTNLTQHDYYSVVALLLLEAVRLSTTTYFGKYVTEKPIDGSVNEDGSVNQPNVITSVGQVLLTAIRRMLEQALLLTVFAISIHVPIRRLKDLNVLAATIDTSIVSDSFDGLKTSLRIFYWLVLINGSIAGLAVIFCKKVVPFCIRSFSLRKYYETIVWKGMDEGFLHATEFDFLAWAFQMQADEYRRGITNVVLKYRYGDLIKFLYCHPRYAGFEAATVALESEDTYRRQAAANIVGLWAWQVKEWAECVKAPGADMIKGQIMLARILMQGKLLAKLAEAIDTDEIGRAASWSFYELGKGEPGALLGLRGGEKGADMMMDCIHRLVKLKRPNALMYVKAMVPLVKYVTEGGMIGEYWAAEKVTKLKDDMWTIVTENANRKRLQVTAAYIYKLLPSPQTRGYTDLETFVREPPTTRQYIMKDELDCLQLVLGYREFPDSWNGLVRFRSIPELDFPLPWLAKPATSLIATLVSVVVLVVASVYISRYGHF